MPQKPAERQHYYPSALTASQAWKVFDYFAKTKRQTGFWHCSNVWFSRGDRNGRVELWFEDGYVEYGSDNKCVHYRKWNYNDS